MATLFRDERANDSPELQLKLQKMSRDFPEEVRGLALTMQAVAVLAGIQNTKLLVNSLLDRLETLSDIQQ